MFIIGARVPARAAKLKSPSQATTTAREENGGGLQSCLQSSSSVQLAACSVRAVQCAACTSMPLQQPRRGNPVGIMQCNAHATTVCRHTCFRLVPTKESLGGLQAVCGGTCSSCIGLSCSTWSISIVAPTGHHHHYYVRILFLAWQAHPQSPPREKNHWDGAANRELPKGAKVCTQST